MRDLLRTVSTLAITLSLAGAAACTGDSGGGGDGGGGSGDGGSGSGAGDTGTGNSGAGTIVTVTIGNGGSGAGGSPPKSDVGDECQADSDCSFDVCLFKGGAQFGICSRTCMDFSECPPFWDCAEVGNGSATYCVPDE